MPTTTTKYCFDGTDLVYEKDGPSTYREYYHGPQGLLSMYDTNGPKRLYHFYDGMGSTTQLINQTKSSWGNYIYDAFGVLIGGALQAMFNPFTYIGKLGYYDGAAGGMSLLQQRYYRATTGRFWTRDPIGDRDDENLFQYAGSMPTGRVDPSGLLHWMPGGKRLCPGFDDAVWVLLNQYYNSRSCRDFFKREGCGDLPDILTHTDLWPVIDVRPPEQLCEGPVPAGIVLGGYRRPEAGLPPMILLPLVVEVCPTHPTEESNWYLAAFLAHELAHYCRTVRKRGGSGKKCQSGEKEHYQPPPRPSKGKDPAKGEGYGAEIACFGGRVEVGDRPPRKRRPT